MSYNIRVSDCIFCKIIAGEVPAQKIWEDDKYLAFLDQYPLCEGQTLVTTKEHQPSYVFALADEVVSGIYLAAKKVARLLDGKLGTERCVQAMEGLGVDHLHIKLYPLTQELKEGGIVHMGPKADEAKLNEIANKIREGGVK
ncbi:MAG: Histidine triad domain protein [Microgenomates group bacterium GW2011_GWB1_44_8]|nr:MAG: Histidine triad domain protein [Microgenomates group bacterium GW2011_GWB1_44_8]